MNEHRCDTSILVQTDHNPLTASRALRLVLACLDDSATPVEAATPVLLDIGGCPACLSGVLLVVAGMAGTALISECRSRGEVVEAMGIKLGMLLDELTGDGA